MMLKVIPNGSHRRHSVNSPIFRSDGDNIISYQMGLVSSRDSVFNDKCSQGFRHLKSWSTVVILILFGEAKEVQCTGGSTSLRVGSGNIQPCPTSSCYLCCFGFATKVWSLCSLFLLPCHPAVMDSSSSPQWTLVPLESLVKISFLPSVALGLFVCIFFPTMTEKEQIKRRNSCSDISAEFCLLILVKVGENGKNGLRSVSTLVYCSEKTLFIKTWNQHAQQSCVFLLSLWTHTLWLWAKHAQLSEVLI